MGQRNGCTTDLSTSTAVVEKICFLFLEIFDNPNPHGAQRPNIPLQTSRLIIERMHVIRKQLLRRRRLSQNRCTCSRKPLTELSNPLTCTRKPLDMFSKPLQSKTAALPPAIENRSSTPAIEYFSSTPAIENRCSTPALNPSAPALENCCICTRRHCLLQWNENETGRNFGGSCAITQDTRVVGDSLPPCLV